MAAQTVVNELVVDASGASSGANQYAAAMQKAEAAANATAGAADKVQAAVDKQTVSMTGSYGRQVSQFNRLAAAADPVVAAQQKLEKVTTTGTKALAAGAITTDQYNNVISLYEERLKRASGTTDDAAHAHAGLSTQAMAAQHSIRGMTEMMIQGVPVTQALGMEMNNLTYAASGPGGLMAALKQGVGVFTELLTPMVLMIGVPAAIAAGFAYLYSSIKTTELEFANLSDRIGSTLSALHGLQSNALLSSGIGEGDFLSQMQKFGDEVANAQHGMGGLAETMRVNGMQAKTFNDYLARAADLVANASSEQEKYRVVQALGLPATQQWVQYLSQGGQAITEAASEANGWGDAAEQQLIAKARKFDTEWAKTWQNFKDEAKQAIIDTSGWMDRLGQALRGGVAAVVGKDALPLMGRNMLIDHSGTSNLSQEEANRFYGAFGNTFSASAGAVGGKATVLPQDAKQALQLEQQRLSLLGSLGSIQDKVRLSEIQINEARLNGVRISGQEEVAILNVVRAQAEWDKINNASQAGVFNLADATRAAADQLKAWQDQGLIDAHNAQEMAAAHQVLADRIKQSADAAALAATPFKGLKQLEIDGADTTKLLDGAGTDMANNFGQALVDIGTGSKTAGDAFKNFGLQVLTSLEQMLVKMYIVAPIAKSLQTIFSGLGGGGILGSLFGGGAGASAPIGVVGGAGSYVVPTFHTGGVVGDVAPSRNVHPAYFENAPRYHLGVDEVPAILQRGERVIPRGGSSGNVTAITIAPTIQIQGGATKADQDQAALISNKVTAELRTMVQKEIITQKRPGGLLQNVA